MNVIETLKCAIKGEVEQSPQPHLKKPMTKARGRNLIDTRMRSKYTGKTCTTLRCIVDGIQVKDWRKDEIDAADAVCSATSKTLMQKSQQSKKWYNKIIHILKDAELIFVVGIGKHGQEQFGVNLTSLEDLPVFNPTDDKEYKHQWYLKRKLAAKKAEVTQ
jgi:putative NADH-flavin reductase